MRIASALIAALALSGCARFTPQPISPADNAARFEQRSLADEALRRYAETNLHRAFPAWPPAAWDLETLTLAAFSFNPGLAVARANCETVAAGKITASQRPNPNLNVSPAHNTTTAVPSPWLVTANLDVPIETAGKRSHRLAQARQLSKAAQFALATAAWEVRTQLRRAMLELWAAQQMQSLQREQLAAREEMVRLLEAEFAAGALSQPEVTRERITLGQSRLAALDAEDRVAQACGQLAGVIGLTRRALDGVPLSFAGFEKPTGEIPATEARRRALFNRTDVLGALAEYAASEAALQLEIAKQYPDVHLSPGYEFDQGDDKWGVGLNVELPVLNRNRGPIAEAEARRRESAAKFSAIQARVFGEIEAALAEHESARRKVAAAAAVLEDSRQQERAAAARAAAGESPRRDVAAAKLETVAAALAEFEARRQEQQSLAALEGALQSPLELPLSLLAPAAEGNHHP